MIIRRLAVENFKGIGAKELFFAEGINLLYGENETGKSSLLEAVEYALFGESGSKKQEYRSLLPWDTPNVKARVELDFSDGESTFVYRIRKSFPDGEASLSSFSEKEGGEAGMRTIAEGREVNPLIREKLGISGEETELLRLLWIRQGESIDLLSGKEGPVDTPVKERLKDILRGSLSPKGSEAIYRRLSEEFEEYRTKTGRLVTKRGSRGARIGELEEEIRRSGEEESRYRERIENLERQRDEIREKRSEQAELQSRKEKMARRIEGLRRKYERSRDLRGLRSELEPLQNELSRFRRSREATEEAGKRLPVLFAEYAGGLDTEIAGLEQRIGELDRLSAQLSSLETAQRSRTGIRKEETEEAKRLAQEIREKLLLLEKTDFHVALRTEGDLPLRLEADGRSVDPASVSGSGEERGAEATGSDGGESRLQVSRRFLLSYPGHLQLEVTGPLSQKEFDTLQTEIEDRRRRLEELLSGYGVDDPAALEELYEREREQERELNTVRQRYEAARPKELRARLEELQTERRAVPPEMEPEGASSNELSEGGLGSISSEIKRVRDRIEDGEALCSEILERLGVKNFDELRERRDELKEEVEKTERHLAEEEPKDVQEVDRKLLDTREGERARLEEEIARLGREIASIEGALGNHEDYEDLLSDAEYRARRAEEELREENIRLAAIETVLQEMERKKAELEERIYEPLEERVSAHFAALTGERYHAVRLGEGLEALRVETQGYDGGLFEVEPRRLSYGTREQLSFMFRLAVADFLSGRERQLMLLDDSFVNSDTRRLPRLLELLSRYSERIQAVLFTCRKDELGELEGMERDVHIIRMDQM